MPDIFINYRTGDEEANANLIDNELSRRFGSKQVFRASKSIPLGENYVRKLLAAVRDSEVLLVVIGPRWLTAVDEQGRNRLHNEADWTRKEILEAFEHSVRVIPVLVGRTERLRPLTSHQSWPGLPTASPTSWTTAALRTIFAIWGTDSPNLSPRSSTATSPRRPPAPTPTTDGARRRYGRATTPVSRSAAPAPLSTTPAVR